MAITNDLVEICRRHILRYPFVARFPEPYIPYIPRKWNRILVLAEAQNLGKRSPDVAWLESATPEERIRRLGRDGRIAIQPWDDGSLKLAVEAALSVRAAETAVSNGVLWSLVDDKDNNKNPTPDLIRKSTALWVELFSVMKPKSIISAGAIARRIVANALKQGHHKANYVAWPLPSPRVFSPVSNASNRAELLRRFPEVASVVQIRQEWIRERAPSKILFACLAVAAVNGATQKGNQA